MSESLDTNFDGIVDQVALDTNADGMADTWQIDTNQDGVFDQYAVDTNLDGTAELWMLDNNQDGYIEETAFDTNLDTVADTWHIDVNADAVVQANEVLVDTNLDGYADAPYAVESPAPTSAVISSPNQDPTITLLEAAQNLPPADAALLTQTALFIQDSNNSMIDTILAPTEVDFDGWDDDGDGYDY